MSEMSDLILPLGLVILGAYGIQRLFSGYTGAAACTGGIDQTCLGPVCWSTCASPGTPANPTPVSNNDDPANSGGTPVVNQSPCTSWYDRWFNEACPSILAPGTVW